MDYQISNIDYPNNYQTLFGLYRNLDIKDVFEYFQNPEHTGFERLPERYMKKTKAIRKSKYGEDQMKPLITLSQEHQQRIQENIKNFQELQKEGKEMEYKNAKFIVDMEEKIKDGPQTSGYHKDEKKNNRYGYFTIRSKRQNIYMYSPKKMPVMIEGFPTESNGHFLIVNNPTLGDLERILGIFTTGNAAVKDDIMKRLRELQENKDTKTMTKEDIQKRAKSFLRPLTEQDMQIGRKHTGVINNINDKVAYITLDDKNIFNGKIQVKDKQELKKYKR